MDILDPDLAARVGGLGAADAEGVAREACALFVAGYRRDDAYDLARALHWLLRGNPRACSSAEMVRILTGPTPGGTASGGTASGEALSDAQCAALAFALDLSHEAARGTARSEQSVPLRQQTGELAELLALGRRLALALALTRRSDYFLSEMYSREEILTA